MDKKIVKIIDDDNVKQLIKQSFDKLYNSTDNLVCSALTDNDDMGKITSLIVINDEEDLFLRIQRLCKTSDLLMSKILGELFDNIDFISTKEGKKVIRKALDKQYNDSTTKEEKIQSIKKDNKKIISDLNALKCRIKVISDCVDECFDRILNCYGSSLLETDEGELENEKK